MQFSIVGADRKSGHERRTIVEADCEKDALAAAKAEGIFPYLVEVMPPPRIGLGNIQGEFQPHPQGSESTPATPVAVRSEVDTTPNAGLLLLVVVAVLLMIWTLRDSNPVAGPMLNTPAPANPEVLLRNDDSTDRHLKELPSMRGRSDSDKEHIISEAKRLNAALEELYRKRGY